MASTILIPENWDDLLMSEKVFILVPELQRWLQHATATRAWENYTAAKQDVQKYVGMHASEYLIGHLPVEHQELLRSTVAYDAVMQIVANLFGE